MTLDYDALDPGIRDVVRLLREHGVGTQTQEAVITETFKPRY